jgi:hypothetical protein
VKRTLAIAGAATVLATVSLIAGRFIGPAHSVQFSAQQAVTRVAAEQVAVHYVLTDAPAATTLAFVNGGALRPRVHIVVTACDHDGLPRRADHAGYWRVDLSRPSVTQKLTVVIDRQDGHVAAVDGRRPPPDFLP